MQTIQINDNIRLHYISMAKLKTTSFSVCIHRPLCENEASKNALLPLVLKSGCERLPDREAIAKELDSLYGATMGATVLKMGEDHLIYFDAESISDCYAPYNEPLLSELLGVLMSVLFEPKVINDAFDETIVEQEKKNAIDRIEAFVNDKRQYAATRCEQETARGTNYAIMRFGDKDKIASITSKELYSYYKAIITSSVIDIYICGDADIKAAEETIRKYTERLRFTPANIPATELIVRDCNEINNVKESMDVSQGKLSMSFLTNTPVTDKNYYALVVLNSVFGAGTHSKLFNNVREKLSLAYYASSHLEKQKGMIVVNAGIEFDNFQKAYDEVLFQLDEIRNGNISEHEFDSSIISLVNMCNSYFDDQRAMAIFYLNQSVCGTNIGLEEYIENIRKVTVDDVREAAKRLTLDTVYFLCGKENE